VTVGEAARSFSIVHDIPGRLRLRLPVDIRGEDLVEAIEGMPGVESCRWTPRTRGLLVRYQPDAASPADVVRAVSERTGFAPRPTAQSTARSNGAVSMSSALVGTFTDVNQRLERATRGTVGLQGLVPLALVGWAAMEFLRGRVTPLTWSTALWYAHGLFRDYNVTPPPS
jgi:heavy-metal-associated domain-containing protein